MLVIKCGGCSLRFEFAIVSRRPVSMKVEANTPLVILDSYVEVFASLTQVNKAITFPFKSKLMITMMKEIEPPKAAPNNLEKLYALQIGAFTVFPDLSL